MIESFKLIAKELKRALKLTVYLPLDYNNTDHLYNCIYMLDGQYFFNDIYNDKTLNLADLFDEIKLNYIVIAIHAPSNPKWRLSELVPFNMGEDYENTLSPIFASYITGTLIPLLKEKYRMYSFPALFGFGESSILTLSLLKEFKSVALFSPKLLGYDYEIKDFLMNLTNKNIFIYSGNNDSQIINSTLALTRILDSNKNLAYYLEFSETNSNEKEDWKKYIIEAFKYLME